MSQKNCTNTDIVQILQKRQGLALQECVGLLNFWFNEVEWDVKLEKNYSRRLSISVFDAAPMWRRWFNIFNSDLPTSESDDDKHFLKHCIEVLQVLNKETQNQPALFEEIVTRSVYKNCYFFESISDLFIWDYRLEGKKGYLNGYAQEKRGAFEAGLPRVGFLWIWNYLNSRKKNHLSSREMNIEDHFAEAGTWYYEPQASGSLKIRDHFIGYFDEGGTWDYEQDTSGSLKLVFKHCVLSDCAPPRAIPTLPGHG